MKRDDESGGTGEAAVAANELYGLPREEFVAARNQLARQARGQGAKDAAAAISQLAKPSMVAWLANQLVRQRRDLIGGLLELGGAMREATAELNTARLRQLSGEQRLAVRALVRQASELASAAGQPFAESTARGLTETLHAAMADERAAGQLSAGQLTSGLAQSGFPAVTASRAPATTAGRPAPITQTPPATTAGRPAPITRTPPATSTTASTAPADHELAGRAMQDEAAIRAAAQADARDAAAAAGHTRQLAHAALARAERAVSQAQENADRLRTALDTAVRAHADADRARNRARQDADDADESARLAEERLSAATERRRDLERQAARDD